MRLVRVLVAACGVAMIAVAGALLLQWREDVATAQDYLDQPCTANPVPATCPNVTSATVLGTWTDRDSTGGIRAWVRIVPAAGGLPRVLQGIWPNDAFLAAHRGSHVEVIGFHGAAVTLRLDPDPAHPHGLRLWTVDHPVPDRDLNRDRGLAAGGVGVLAVVLAAPRRVTRLPARRLREALADRGLRVALLAFTAVQLLDVATSVAGRHRLLYEGIPLTRAVVDRLGDPGFLAVKVPALLAVLVLTAWLPRRYAWTPVVAAAAPVAIVVGGNLRLLAG